MLQPPSFLVLLVGVLISGAAIVSARPTKSSTDTVTLAAGETVKICCDAELKIDSIEDSRCPANAICVWAGRATVDVTVSNSQGSNSAQLILDSKDQSHALITVGRATYDVTLNGVTPYPGTGKPPSQATIQILCP